MPAIKFDRARLAIVILAAGGALLTGCGNAVSSASSASSSGTSSSSTTSTSSGSAPSNDASSVAMSADAAGTAFGGGVTFTQTSDTLLGTTANTDDRLFKGSDGTILEIDIAVASTSTEAGTAYTAFAAQAAKNVSTKTGSSNPAIGSQSEETVGTNANGQTIVSLAFQQNLSIVVLTVINPSVGGTVSTSAVEGLAGAQLLLLKK